MNKLNLYDNIIKVPKINLLGLNGKKFSEVNRSISVKLNFKNSYIEVQVLLVLELEYDILLGSDELQKHNAKINYEKRCLIIDGIGVEFENDNLKLRIKERKNVSENESTKLLSRLWKNDNKYNDNEVETKVVSINEDIKKKIMCYEIIEDNMNYKENNE